MGSLLVGQSGGPTAVINSTICGVFKEALKHQEITHLYGAIHGIDGVINERFIEIKDESNLDLWQTTPGAILGSVRLRLKKYPEDLELYEKILSVFKKYDITYFFYCGGNDSMDTCNKLSLYFKEKNVDIYGVEGAGLGLNTGMHSSAIYNNMLGIMHGMKTYIMQDEKGNIKDNSSLKNESKTIPFFIFFSSGSSTFVIFIGVGFLYIKVKTKIKPLLYGGGQQRDLRPSTENVPGIAGMAEAVRYCYEDMSGKRQQMYELKAHFVAGIKALEGTHIHGYDDENSAPHVVSVGFEGIKSEVLLHSLEDRGIYVSSGSACASNHPAISGTLKSIGSDAAYLDSTIRFSFSDLNTIEEADICLQALKELLPALRRYRRK